MSMEPGDLNAPLASNQLVDWRLLVLATPSQLNTIIKDIDATKRHRHVIEKTLFWLTVFC